jgi:hypothetical protein
MVSRPTPERRFVLLPGPVLSAHDGQAHIIDASRLGMLYRLRPNEYYILNPVDYRRATATQVGDHQLRMSGFLLQGIMPLRPRETGDYDAYRQWVETNWREAIRREMEQFDIEMSRPPSAEQRINNQREQRREQDAHNWRGVRNFGGLPLDARIRIPRPRVQPSDNGYGFRFQLDATEWEQLVNDEGGQGLSREEVARRLDESGRARPSNRQDEWEQAIAFLLAGGADTDQFTPGVVESVRRLDAEELSALARSDSDQGQPGGPAQQDAGSVPPGHDQRSAESAADDRAARLLAGRAPRRLKR